MLSRGGVSALAAGHFLAMFDRAIFAAVVPLIAVRYTLSDTQSGVLLGPAIGVTYAVVAVLLGRFADRGYARTLALGGLAVWSTASLTTGLANGFGAFLAARMFLAAGQAAFIPAALKLLFDRTRPAARSIALSTFVGGSALGRSVALLVAGLVLTGFAAAGIDATEGWRLLFAATALPNIALIAVVARLLPSGTPLSEPLVSEPAVERVERDGVSTAVLAAFFVVAVMPLLVIQSVAAWMPSVLVRGDMFTQPAAATSLGAVYVVFAPGSAFLGGFVIRRYPSLLSNASGAIVAGLVVAVPFVVAAALARNVWAIGTGMAGLTLLLGVAAFTGLYEVQRLAGDARRGRVGAAFLATTTLVAVGLGPLLTGLLSDLGRGASGDLGGALVFVAVIACVVAILGSVALRTLTAPA